MKGNGKAKHRRGTASRRFVRQWYGSALHSKGVALSREAGQSIVRAQYSCVVWVRLEVARRVGIVHKGRELLLE